MGNGDVGTGDTDRADAERFAGIMRTHHRHVLAYAVRRMSSRQAAEDLTSETFLVAWRRFAQVPPDPLPWLYGTARGLLLNERRRSARRWDAERRGGAFDEPAGDPGIRVVEADRVRSALAELTESDRELLMLIGWEGLSVGQAARVLGAPAPVVSVRLYRARHRLSQRLTAHDRSSVATGDQSIVANGRSA
jgi:RNA polymerase sigma-70 factor, ECF subfamily